MAAARDLAPRLAHAVLPIPGKGSADWGDSWVPVAEPFAGGIIGGVAYPAVSPLWRDPAQAVRPARARSRQEARHEGGRHG